MDENSYPDITKLVEIFRQKCGDEEIILGFMRLNDKDYFAKYKVKSDILDISSYNKRYLFTPTDKAAFTKYVLIIDKAHNTQITFDEDNNVVDCQTLTKGNYGIHFN
jgi:hypothetical protein